ncbi:hypothetical protein SELMODRAFT_432349 [Selaginella moellendorffii]|uniref:Uncharacterized protein n=1 Tax=Selaginella moellendorffii TaxID=88036 RepID=D8TFR0_SELML|nr:uncharacterized protein LOC9641026 [Selaginella moellendorffii]XP_024523722.1 uncharacterized protein LOC9641026 [Selaginella moellendorffii]EFJ04505.1 hypothetical protein SELMODRAFT_432349 [Selaginella moellendorffii]|eukprot:XP_002994426.1 uncharacterized protein LOC9641026 [Selaginella moellendorffii]
MTMIVREMILLDQACFEPDDPHSFNDDSGWLGPPSAVPFAWELAPGTPKQERKSAPEVSDSTREAFSGEVCKAIVKVESEGEDSGEPDRHSVHILENAPRSFLESRNSEVSGEPADHFKERTVAFKWEMEPGIPRDPLTCREVLDCPLTPPPVFHSRSMVVYSSRSSKKTFSLSERLRSLLWIQPHRKQPDFQTRLNPPGRASSKTTKATLLLKNSPHNGSSNSLSKKNGAAHSDEEEDLSPVSVLDYNSSMRSSSHPADNSNNSNRLSSASSSRRSHYHTPQHSFSGDVNAANLSSTGSFTSFIGSSKRSSLSALLIRRNKNREPTGCLTMLRSNSFATTNDSFEEAVSEVNSSDRSSSLSSDENHKKPGTNKDCGESSDEDARSVYFSPAPNIESPRKSFSFQSRAMDDERDAAKFKIIDRVDSLETIDPGFAPSELGDVSYQRNILNRMTSCARWQRKQASIKQTRSGSHLARSLFGRVTVCCYVPREDQC